MNSKFESRYGEEIALFKDIYFSTRDVKTARSALEQRNIHPKIINKVSDFVISSIGSQIPFSGGQKSLTGVREREDAEIRDIQSRAGLNELKGKSTLIRRDAHKRTMKQFDEITKPLAKLASLAYDADIPFQTLVEELREMVHEMYTKKDERKVRADTLDPETEAEISEFRPD